jgi:hypothetical protein
MSGSGKKYKLKERQISLNDEYDVIVVGGGPAGCAAATAAARAGAKTFLIERNGALGGMGTLGLVPWFCGYDDGKNIIARGLAEHVRLALCQGMPLLKKWISSDPLCPPAIAPELLKRIYDDLVTRAGAKVLFFSQLCSVEMSDGGNVDALLVSNKSGLTAYRAKVYVDCTGEGDLAAMAGAAFEKGDINGNLQPATHCFGITNVDEYAVNSGSSIHFYNQDSPVNKAVKSGRYPLIADLHSCSIQIGPGTYSFNTGHVFDVDNTDPESVSNALVHGRKQAAQYHQAFSEFHPAFANSFLVATGAVLGVRETRRILGDYFLIIDDYMARRSFPDEICRNAYPIDVHGSKKDAAESLHKDMEELNRDNEKIFKQLDSGESYGVPYRCLTPKSLKNVLVAGRCISTDRSINGSVRIMACCLTTGEAAGIASAMSAAEDGNVHNVNTDALRRELRDKGAYLP